jgi:chromosome segregation ATPase
MGYDQPAIEKLLEGMNVSEEVFREIVSFAEERIAKRKAEEAEAARQARISECRDEMSTLYAQISHCENKIKEDTDELAACKVALADAERRIDDTDDTVIMYGEGACEDEIAENEEAYADYRKNRFRIRKLTCKLGTRNDQLKTMRSERATIQTELDGLLADGEATA